MSLFILSALPASVFMSVFSAFFRFFEVFQQYFPVILDIIDLITHQKVEIMRKDKSTNHINEIMSPENYLYQALRDARIQRKILQIAESMIKELESAKFKET